MKKDLSSQTLEKVFREIDTKQEIKMPQKYFWALMGGTAVLSSLISIGCFYALSSLAPSHSPSLQMEEVEKYITKILGQQKPVTDSFDQLNTQVTDLKIEIADLKEMIEIVKQQQVNASTTSSSETSSQGVTVEDPLERASLLVNTLLESLIQDNEVPSTLWQQLPRIIEKTSISLPEKLKNISEPPASKQRLIQEIQSLDIKNESIAVTPPNNEAGTKISHPWLEKIERFIGQIVINQEALPKKPAIFPSLKEKAILAIQTQSLAEIKKILQDLNTPDSLKSALRQAELHIEITQDLLKVKQELLEKIFIGKE